MKTTTKMFAVSALAMLVSGGALAGGNVAVTRSTADMEADLTRTYTNPGGPPAGQIKSRSEAERYSDLIRDWDGSQAKAQGSIVGVESSAPVVGTRSTEEANKDLMRIWQ